MTEVNDFPVDSLGVGLHDLPCERYYDDPAPEPSLNASGIKILESTTPAHFAAQHPQLTRWPEAVRTATKEQDLGSLVHALVLEKGAEVAVIDAPGFRKKAAQDARDYARQNGQIPVLRKTFDQALEIASNAREALKQRFGTWPLGQSEITALWQIHTPLGYIWGRGLLDHWSKDAAAIIDVKTTSKPLDDESLSKHVATFGYDLQDVWYTDGLTRIFPDLAGRIGFYFAFVEVEPPFGTRIVQISEAWRTRARFRVERAVGTFAECLYADRWPSWPDSGSTLSAPSWLENKWTAAELGEEA